MEEGCRLGLDQLTLYCLSVENWKRPPRELAFLMRLLRHFLIVERGELFEQNVHLKMIGRRDGLPVDVLREFERTAEQTASNDGMTLCLAVNYGGRSEIGDAARRLAEDVRAGWLEPDLVDEGLFATYLYTEGMSDPDLLIRTAGEMRISNFLLWQISTPSSGSRRCSGPTFAATTCSRVACVRWPRTQVRRAAVRRGGNGPRAGGRTAGSPWSSTEPVDFVRPIGDLGHVLSIE